MLTNRQVTEYINRAMIEFSRNGNSDKFETICKEIINNANINQMITFIKNVQGANILPFSMAVLERGDARQNFEMACISGSDSKAHRDFIINSQDIECNLLAGKVINDKYRDEYVNKHGDIVLKGTAYQNYKYLKNNRSSALNRQRHFDMIIDSGILYINHICAKDIAGANVLEHGKVILDSRRVPDNIAFARIKGADVKAHLNIVLQYGTANDNFDVLQMFGNRCDMQKHVFNIFESNDNEVKYNCLMWLRQTNLINMFESCKALQKFIQDLYDGKISIDDITNEDKDDYIY